MRQDLLVDQTTEVLHSAGFVTSKRCDVRSRCFDITARRGTILLFLKMLSNIDVDELPPLIYAAPGGLYVKLDGQALYATRTRMNLSLGAIASELGVSRRSIRKYEEGMDAKVEIAVRLEAVLDTPCAVPISLLTRHVFDTERAKPETLPPIERKVISLLVDLGFTVLPMFQAPFDMLSQTK